MRSRPGKTFAVSLPEMDHPIALDSLSGLSEKWVFVGVDLAPSDSLETGIAVIDRQKNLMRMDKVDLDKDIFLYLNNLGPKSGVIIALDIPKSLNYSSKWRQQQVKMHPMRLLSAQDERDEQLELGSASQRFAARANDFYRRATHEGFFVVNFFSHYAKMRYGIHVPYRSRSPQGCRALQQALKEVLKIKNLPSNLAPSSVLDAMIGSYIAWSLYQAERLSKRPPRGKNGKNKMEFTMPFELYEDKAKRLFVNPLALCPMR